MDSREEGKRITDEVDSILVKHMKGDFPAFNFKINEEWLPVLKKAIKVRRWKPIGYFFNECCDFVREDGEKDCSKCILGNPQEETGWCYEYTTRSKGFIINQWINREIAKSEMEKTLDVLEAMVEATIYGVSS